MKVERTVTISEHRGSMPGANAHPRGLYELRTGDGETVTIRPLPFVSAATPILLEELADAIEVLQRQPVAGV